MWLPRRFRNKASDDTSTIIHFLPFDVDHDKMFTCLNTIFYICFNPRFAWILMSVRSMHSFAVVVVALTLLVPFTHWPYFIIFIPNKHSFYHHFTFILRFKRLYFYYVHVKNIHSFSDIFHFQGLLFVNVRLGWN